jgi:uncharacterized protein (TIGR02246 family)
MRLASVLVPMFLATASAQTGAAASAPAQADAAIVAVADAYVKASLARDAKAVAALYTEDAVEMPPHEPAVKGRAAIEAYYQKQFSDPKMTASNFTLAHVETVSSGDVGYDVGTYRQTLTSPSGPIEDTGKYTVILKRAGGAWKVAYAIYNSDRPPAMSAAAPQD